MKRKPELLDIIDIFWTCQDCDTELKESSPVYTNIYGEFVEFSCYVCQHDYKIQLDEVNN
jgi:hypothetical protein